jgi:hypothetical protein
LPAWREASAACGGRALTARLHPLADLTEPMPRREIVAFEKTDAFEVVTEGST